LAALTNDTHYQFRIVYADLKRQLTCYLEWQNRELQHCGSKNDAMHQQQQQQQLEECSQTISVRDLGDGTSIKCRSISGVSNPT